MIALVLFHLPIHAQETEAILINISERCGRATTLDLWRHSPLEANVLQLACDPADAKVCHFRCTTSNENVVGLARVSDVRRTGKVGEASLP